MRKLFTFIFPGRLRVAVVMALLLHVAESVANADNGNASTVAIPTLDGLGLATLAGGLAMVGAWAMARARRKK